MDDLRQQYLARANDDVLEAAALLAVDLMRGDPAEFKSGYTFQNAVYAVCDLYAITAISLVGDIGYRIGQIETASLRDDLSMTSD